jgi:hypothetical protein
MNKDYTKITYYYLWNHPIKNGECLIINLIYNILQIPMIDQHKDLHKDFISSPIYNIITLNSRENQS